MIRRHRRILLATALVEVRGRFAGSVGGLLWVMLGPLLLMTLYALIYAVIFRVRPPELSELEYVLYILCGLVPFIGFSEGLQAGTTSLSANKEILLNTVFPAELVPLRAVLVSTFSSISGLALLVIAGGAVGTTSWTMLLLPIVVVLQTMFLIGLVWVLALANLILRDIQQILTYLTIILLIASPIAYTPSMIPSLLRPLIYLNPLSYFVIATQHLMILGTLPPWDIALIGTALAVGMFLLGHWTFARAKQVFFDYA